MTHWCDAGRKDACALNGTLPTEEFWTNWEATVGFRWAFEYLEMYASAKLVVTSRIHSALPSIALGTPVVFMDGNDLPGGQRTRVQGLLPLFHSADVLPAVNPEQGRFPAQCNQTERLRLAANLLSAPSIPTNIRDSAHKFGVVDFDAGKRVNRSGSDIDQADCSSRARGDKIKLL